MTLILRPVLAGGRHDNHILLMSGCGDAGRTTLDPRQTDRRKAFARSLFVAVRGRPDSPGPSSPRLPPGPSTRPGCHVLSGPHFHSGQSCPLWSSCLPWSPYSFL